MAGETIMARGLLILISLLLVIGLGIRPLTGWLHKRWVGCGIEGEQLLLWGGLFLSGLSLLLLVLYLFL